MHAFLDSYGLIILFLAIFLESAGAPVPGEATLITSGVLASRGSFSVESVIGIAIAAAVIGDNVGYLLGRFWLPHLFHRFPRLERRAERLLPASRRLFARHGGKAVFFARFLPVLRVTGAWTAGLSEMTWWRFLVWNILGGAAWATTYGLVAYGAGEAAADAITKYGIVAAVLIVLVVAVAVVVHVRRSRAHGRDVLAEETEREGELLGVEPEPG